MELLPLACLCLVTWSGSAFADENDPVLKARIPGAALQPRVEKIVDTNDGAVLMCSVRRAATQPHVEWQDSAGNTLTAEEPVVSKTFDRYQVILVTTVAKTDTYRCVATQKEINHQTHADIHVSVSMPTTGWVIAGIIGIFLFIFSSFVLFYVVLKRYYNKQFNTASQTNTSYALSA